MRLEITSQKTFFSSWHLGRYLVPSYISSYIKKGAILMGCSQKSDFITQVWDVYVLYSLAVSGFLICHLWVIGYAWIYVKIISYQSTISCNYIYILSIKDIFFWLISFEHSIRWRVRGFFPPAAHHWCLFVTQSQNSFWFYSR